MGMPFIQVRGAECPGKLYVLTHSPPIQSCFIPPPGLGLAASRCGNDLSHSENNLRPKSYYKLQGKQPDVYEATLYNPASCR